MLTVEVAHAGMAQPFTPENFDGMGYSAGWNSLVNDGQVYDLAEDPRDDVRFHSVGTIPSIYAMD